MRSLVSICVRFVIIPISSSVRGFQSTPHNRVLQSNAKRNGKSKEENALLQIIPTPRPTLRVPPRRRLPQRRRSDRSRGSACARPCGALPVRSRRACPCEGPTASYISAWSTSTRSAAAAAATDAAGSAGGGAVWYPGLREGRIWIISYHMRASATTERMRWRESVDSSWNRIT